MRIAAWTIVLAATGGLIYTLLAITAQNAKEAARRTKCKSHLKQISLALHNYENACGCFPPAYTVDASGNRLHSWRTLILPYVDQGELFKQIRFDEPWDSPHNIQFLTRMPPVYRCLSDHAAAETSTNYAAVFGPNSIFRGAESVYVRDAKDGLRNTLMIGEIKGRSIPWMKPEDVDVTLHPALDDPAGFGSHHVGGSQFSMGDGSVRFVGQNTPLRTLQALYTIDGDDFVGEF